MSPQRESPLLARIDAPGAAALGPAVLVVLAGRVGIRVGSVAVGAMKLAISPKDVNHIYSIGQMSDSKVIHGFLPPMIVSRQDTLTV